jgi:hypothetical protein
MARPRAEYRNEVKTRLPDDVYVRLMKFREDNFIESDSKAVERLLRMLLCGIVRGSDETVSGALTQTGPRERV